MAGGTAKSTRGVVSTTMLAATLGVGGCATAPHADERSDPYIRMGACVAPAEEADAVSISDPASFTAVWAFSMVHCRDGVAVADSERAWLERERRMRARARKAERTVDAAAVAAEAPPR